MISAKYIAQLILKHCNNTLSKQEKEVLNEWLAISPKNRAIFKQQKDDFHRWKKEILFVENITDNEWKEFEKVYEKLFPEQPVKRKSRPNLLHVVRSVAACLLLISATVVYLFLIDMQDCGSTKYLYRKIDGFADNEIKLRLANDTYISLDTIVNCQLPHQGDNCLIIKDGDLHYLPMQDESLQQPEGAFNQIYVPAGRQYTVVLADGSRISLNAASSICFPVSGYSHQRTVELRGEAFFQITSIDSSKTKIPFTIHVKTPTDLSQEVTVTGTAFNINAYCDEPFIKTTLFEGRLAVARDGENISLKPGEELRVGKSYKTIVKNRIVGDAVAWKKGSFVFTNTPIQNVIKEVNRWYGIPVAFKDTSGPIDLSIPRSEEQIKVLKAIFFQANYDIQKEGDSIRLIKLPIKKKAHS